MITFPNCKINLGLHVTRKREDGYHDLETGFYPICLRDSLEVIRADEFTFQSTGLTINDDTQNNLCVKAYDLLKRDFPLIPAVQIHLHKTIPMGAGLGGGSADAAFMLTTLNRKFTLNLSEEQLTDYALQLGSDCPFFIINKSCFATGRGEILESLELDLSAYKILLINPGIHVSTKEAFSNLIPQEPAESIKQIVQQPVETWKQNLRNDFEQTVFATHPAIKNIKDELYNRGAVYAAMTGTGSTVFGLFAKDQTTSLPFPKEYFVSVISIKKVRL